MGVNPMDVPETIDAVELAERAIAQKVAILLLGGKKTSEIGRELNLKPYQVKKIVQSYHCKKTVLDLADTALSTARAQFQFDSASLAKGTFQTLKHHIDNRNLNAVPLVMKILAIGDKEVKSDGPAVFNVILPGESEKPKSVTPEYRTVDIEVSDERSE